MSVLGRQMRRAEVYADPEGGAGSQVVYDNENDYMGRYDPGEIEAGSGSHSWNEQQGLQEALFPHPNQDPQRYKEQRSIESRRASADNAPSGVVQDTINNSDIPQRDLQNLPSSVTVHSSESWGEQKGDAAEAERSFYRPRALYRQSEVHMAPGQESDQRVLVHELGHAVHFGQVEQTASFTADRAKRGAAQQPWLVPRTYAGQHPHPVLEGTADGYADRYSTHRDERVMQSARIPEGDDALRARASQSFSAQNEEDIGYTGRYEKHKSDGEDHQTPWAAHDRVRYLAARQFTGTTGSPMWLNEAPDRTAPRPAWVETGQMLLQADEAHRQATGQSENHALNRLIADSIPMAPPTPSGEPGEVVTKSSTAAHHALVGEMLQNMREEAIKWPTRPRGYRATGDSPVLASEEANHAQLTLDSPEEGENYRLSVHKATRLGGR